MLSDLHGVQRNTAYKDDYAHITDPKGIEFFIAARAVLQRYRREGSGSQYASKSGEPALRWKVSGQPEAEQKTKLDTVSCEENARYILEGTPCSEIPGFDVLGPVDIEGGNFCGRS